MRNRTVVVAALLVAGLSLPGCQTFGKVVDVVDWTGGALSASAEILRGAGQDIGAVWGATGGVFTGAIGIEPIAKDAPAKEASDAEPVK